MFCPKCSQQQISDEARFCSRCGLQLGVVKAMLSVEGEMGVPPTLGLQTQSRSSRKRDMTLGAFIMYVLAIFVGIIGLNATPGEEGPVLLLIVLGFLYMLGLNLGPLFRYFFGRDAADAQPRKKAPGIFSRTPTEAALPPARAMPTPDFGTQRVNTAEVVRPPSVTEQTTNLLDKS